VIFLDLIYFQNSHHFLDFWVLAALWRSTAFTDAFGDPFK